MSPGRHLRQPAHFPDTTAARRGRSTTSRTAVQDKLHALLDLNERNTQLEEQALKGRQTNEIAIKASADAVMLAANAVCCSRCCTKKKKIKRRCAFCVRSMSGRGSYWKWKRQTLQILLFMSFCLSNASYTIRNLQEITVYTVSCRSSLRTAISKAGGLLEV